MGTGQADDGRRPFDRFFHPERRYTSRPFGDSGESSITLVLPASWATMERRETKGRGRPLGSFLVSFRRSHETSFEMSFELSFQRSFDASFRRSFEASDDRSDALSFEMSDARSDEASSEMSDGRSYEVSFRVSFLRCFPANSETSFPTSFQGSIQRCACERAKHLSGQFAVAEGGWREAERNLRNRWMNASRTPL